MLVAASMVLENPEEASRFTLVMGFMQINQICANCKRRPSHSCKFMSTITGLQMQAACNDIAAPTAPHPLNRSYHLGFPQASAAGWQFSWLQCTIHLPSSPGRSRPARPQLKAATAGWRIRSWAAPAVTLPCPPPSRRSSNPPALQPPAAGAATAAPRSAGGRPGP